MTFTESIRTCVIKKYLDWNGRASRSEFWWFYLTSTILCSVTNGIVGLLLFCPMICATTRRLHDTGRSGWWQLMPTAMFLVSAALLAAGILDGSAAPAIIGLLVLLGSAGTLFFFLAQAGTAEDVYNPYGSSPYNPETELDPAERYFNYTGKKTCPNCSAAISENSHYCPSCGINLDHLFKVSKCVNCGITLESDALFCPSCGFRQPENSAPNNTRQEEENMHH